MDLVCQISLPYFKAATVSQGCILQNSKDKWITDDREKNRIKRLTRKKRKPSPIKKTRIADKRS